MQTLIRAETKKLGLKLRKLTKMVIKNHDKAKLVIRNNDKKLAVEVIEFDYKIDTMYMEIESDIEFLIVKAPVDKDLRRTLANIHIARELARTADYAKHIAKFVIKGEKIANSSIDRIDRVHKLFRRMLTGVESVMSTESVAKANKIAELGDQIEEMVKDTIVSIISSISIKKDPEKIKERVFVLNVLNALLRGSDHLINICEMILYINTGSHRTYK